MNRLADARRALADALSPVLPGRAGAYPPPKLARNSTPHVFIDQPRIGVPTAGLILATFPVWCVVDGADHAQIALLDDLVARVWDAVEASGGMRAENATPRSLPVDVDMTTTTRAAVVEVAVTIAARVFCPPVVEAATVPPELVGA